MDLSAPFSVLSPDGKQLFMTGNDRAPPKRWAQAHRCVLADRLTAVLGYASILERHGGRLPREVIRELAQQVTANTRGLLRLLSFPDP